MLVTVIDDPLGIAAVPVTVALFTIRQSSTVAVRGELPTETSPHPSVDASTFANETAWTTPDCTRTMPPAPATTPPVYVTPGVPTDLTLLRLYSNSTSAPAAGGPSAAAVAAQQPSAQAAATSVTIAPVPPMRSSRRRSPWLPVPTLAPCCLVVLSTSTPS